MTRIAITGIGGFIGLRMTERALALGWEVTGVDLSAAGVEQACSKGAKAVQGDVTDGASLTSSFQGADLVFHTAAIVQEDGPRELYERVNNRGTKTVAETAMACGVRRMVHLSSIMVYGFDSLDPVSEAGPFATDTNPYNATKLSSEQIALSYNQPDQGFGVIVIRPGDVYGYGSIPWVVRPMEMMRNHQFMLPDGGRGVINHVHVDNLIDGVLLAIEKDACGEAFNITDDQATPASTYFRYLLAMLGQRWLPTAPGWLLLPVMAAANRALPVLGITPPASSAAVRFLQRKHKISCDKARSQLGYHPAISLPEGMRKLETELRNHQQL